MCFGWRWAISEKRLGWRRALINEGLGSTLYASCMWVSGKPLTLPLLFEGNEKLNIEVMWGELVAHKASWTGVVVYKKKACDASDNALF